jgi:hypothetical protein
MKQKATTKRPTPTPPPTTATPIITITTTTKISKKLHDNAPHIIGYVV